MIYDFMVTLSSMLASSPGIAITGAFLWGMAGILLSPCHLAGIPLIVGYIDTQGEMRTSRAALIAALFSAGILVTIVLIGVITGLAGRMMGDIGRYGNVAVAALMIVMGLYLLGVISLPFMESGINQPGMKKKGLLAAFLLGLFFGLALGPCTFAYMAPMLGVAFTVASTNILYSAALVGAYAAGHCIVIIIAGSSAEAVNRLLKWNENSKGAVVVKKICGVLVVLSGCYMMFTAVKL